MDVVWLVFDSLSYDATPFAADGPNTMPNIAELVNEYGINFSRAYAPGPASPSSHASFFTGKLPSEVGMHEAHPYFDGSHLTIVEALNDTHRTHLVTTNPFVWNGLNRSFDETDNLQSDDYLLFESATDPVEFDSRRTDFASQMQKYWHFLTEDGKPIRSLLNGLYFKQWEKNRQFANPVSIGDEIKYQFAETTAEKIRDFLDTSEDAFVFANCMDVHAPLDASDAAIEKFCETQHRDELPIGHRGYRGADQVQAGSTELANKMYDLYKAAIWDLDRKMAPLIEELITNDTLMIVTADHGNWFRRTRGLDERQLHVPLLVFTPEKLSRKVNHTVNIRQLPATTMEILEQDNPFQCKPLLSVEKDQLSITEHIHKPGSGHVQPTGVEDTSDIEYDIAAIKGNGRLDYEESEYKEIRGSDGEIRELRKIIEERRGREITFGSKQSIDYNEPTKQQLKDLGYLE